VFIIRNEQLEVFKHSALNNFKASLLEYIKKYFPNHWQIVGQKQLSKVIKLGIDQANSYGLKSKREIYMYVSLMLYLGSFFDTDIQMDWAEKILNDQSIKNSFVKSRILYDRAEKYMASVYGVDHKYLKAALNRLIKDIKVYTSNYNDYYLERYLHKFFMWFYPEKYNAVGQKKLNEIIVQSTNHTRKYDIKNRRGIIIYSSMMYLLGHHFDKDPQFSWAGNILNNKTILDENLRTEQLYQEVLNFLAKWGERSKFELKAR